MRRSHEIDMTSGPLLSKILLFAIPLMFTNILQLLFNAADTIVVGKFAGSVPLAAVGSTGSLVGLLVNTFVGIATGVNVLVARYYGAKDQDGLSRCVHSAVVFSVFLGLGVAVFGFLLSGPVLRMMKPDPEVLPLSILYLRIYFLGTPATLVYNFGAAVLRAIGDTDRPMRYLTLSGIINVILNLVTVIYLQMGVAGVAIATVVSQYVSAYLVIHCLFVSEGPYQLHRSRLRMEGRLVLEILKIGLPTGLQGSLYSLSNVTIQSAINSFGAAAMAGASASSNIDSFVSMSVASFYHASICFTSQNIGAKRYDRLNRILGCCVSMSLLFSVVLATVTYSFGTQLLSLFISAQDAQRDAVISYGMIRMLYVCVPFFLAGVMDVGGGTLTGMGHPWMPMITSVFGTCVFRVLWVAFIFPMYPTFDMIYILYPITWILTGLLHYIFLFFARRRLKRSLQQA